MAAIDRYNEALANAPGRGGGLHQHIMRCACLGVLAELDQDVIIQDLMGLDGVRRDEPIDAVKKALISVERGWKEPEPRPMNRFAPKLENGLDKFIKGVSQDHMDLIESSPYRLTDSTDTDGHTILKCLYQPDDFLFIGDIFDRDVKRVSEWRKTNLKQFPHIIPNPMTGKEGMTDMGKISWRCENTVADMRFAVCEMDTVPLNKQVAFWVKCIRIGIPVSAVIHSGSKSLHGWVNVECGQDVEKWDKDVRGWLFKEFGEQYGLDSACSNKARLSRLPGFYREGKQQQRLLYLNGDA